MSVLSVEEKIGLVTRNTVDVLTVDDLRALFESTPHPRAYFGTAPTGPFHIGYLIPLTKIYDFERAGISTKVLLADLHAVLDDQKTKWDEMEVKAEYYGLCIKHALKWSKPPEMVRGSSFQIDSSYFKDVLRMSTLATVKRALRAASEVTRMSNPKVSELIYPIMQALDEEYLDVDIQLGGVDQRHILAFAREYLPALGYKKRVEVMVPLIASLAGPGTKMSASIPNSFIKPYDSPDSIKKKIKKAYCPAGDVKDNPILQLFKYFVFSMRTEVVIERDEKFGGDVSYSSYEALEKDFVDQKLHPVDLKNALSKFMVEQFADMRVAMEKKSDLFDVLPEQFRPA